MAVPSNSLGGAPVTQLHVLQLQQEYSAEPYSGIDAEWVKIHR